VVGICCRLLDSWPLVCSFVSLLDGYGLAFLSKYGTGYGAFAFAFAFTYIER
jgi:hypothetical protein